MNKDDIISEIVSAFASVAYPGDENIGDFGENNITDSLELNKELRGKHWRDILEYDSSWYDHNYWALTHFSPQAFHFYLPAFLIRCLSEYKELGLACDWITYYFLSLTERMNNSAEECHECKWDLFDQYQRKAVRDYFLFRKNNTPGDDFRIQEFDKILASLFHEGTIFR